jgi:hypothetical protein
MAPRGRHPTRPIGRLGSGFVVRDPPPSRI